MGGDIGSPRRDKWQDEERVERVSEVERWGRDGERGGIEVVGAARVLIINSCKLPQVCGRKVAAPPA